MSHRNGGDVTEDLLPPALTADDNGGETPLAALTLGVPWRSPAFLESLLRARRFAASRQPVLIEGESGTGKTAFAEILHLRGAAPEQRFTVVNCAALPDSLLESELFGSVRGAFTGAVADRDGLIRAAGAGTVFLDEIDKASVSLQSALLHVLDRREVRSLGGKRPHSVRGRLVFATSRELTGRMEADAFLPDLAYRIRGMSIQVPAVRKRPEDFNLLLALALRDLRISEGIAGVAVAADARDLLASWRWPGNVRELFAIVRAAARLSDGSGGIAAGHVERAAAGSSLAVHAGRVRRPSSLAQRVRDFEREEIVLALRLEGGNQTRAARRLGISRRGLNKKLHRHGLLGALESEGLREFRRKRDRVGETRVRGPAEANGTAA
ncbi:MAG TPA: sigma 54-interacting transcriptional regulator [bacterium]|nr:sigma 54-interacting transcriptional regulator [bacterium]